MRSAARRANRGGTGMRRGGRTLLCTLALGVAGGLLPARAARAQSFAGTDALGNRYSFSFTQESSSITTPGGNPVNLLRVSGSYTVTQLPTGPAPGERDPIYLGRIDLTFGTGGFFFGDADSRDIGCIAGISELPSVGHFTSDNTCAVTVPSTITGGEVLLYNRPYIPGMAPSEAVTLATAPEPITGALTGVGVLVLAAVGARRRRRLRA